MRAAVQVAVPVPVPVSAASLPVVALFGIILSGTILFGIVLTAVAALTATRAAAGPAVLDAFLIGFEDGCREGHDFGLWADTVMTNDKAGRWTITAGGEVPPELAGAFGRPSLTVQREKASDLARLVVPVADATYKGLRVTALELRRSTGYFLADDTVVFAEPEATVRETLAPVLRRARKLIGKGPATIDLKTENGRVRLRCLDKDDAAGRP
ncbi:hypothetical protein [Prosthecodimorpha hirschii]|uniref:hypothetical protein n=1 Tax=Prosthecodimorpha hirschii TaxID=665126 RepID=UPI00112EAF87|nr:hypothetical protein [Prosthecomicrobium hirschii]